MYMKSEVTSLFINPVEFEKAALFAHQYFLSTPFTCPNPARPDERAICLLSNNKIVDVSTAYGCINPDGSVNVEQVNQVYDSAVQKVVYRPNHELLHSLRQAAMIGNIKEYYDRNASGKYTYMQPKHLERLQLMMLFSVAGRKDETGFHDSPEARVKYYLKYREDSAKAFLEYAKNYPGLYDLDDPEEEEQLYHDALMVELMGAPTIPPHEEIEQGNYAIVKMIKERNFSLPSRIEKFPGVYLEFMNTAHSLDLLRVYPPDSHDAANNKKNIEKFIGETLRHLRKENGLNEVNIINCIRDTISILQYSRKMLDESGDKTTTLVELDSEKIEEILSDPVLEVFINDVIDNPTKLDEVKKEISQFLTENVLKFGSYNYSTKRFSYCHYKENSNLDEDRDFQEEVSSGISMLNAVQRPQFVDRAEISVKAAAGASLQPSLTVSAPPPLVSNIKLATTKKSAPPMPSTPPINYNAYVRGMYDLIKNENFLKGKKVPIKSGALGKFFKPDARPTIIEKIRVIIKTNQYEDPQIICEKIQSEINRILDKTIQGAQTHNSDPDTIRFMKAAMNVDSFKDYLEEYSHSKGQKSATFKV